MSTLSKPVAIAIIVVAFFVAAILGGLAGGAPFVRVIFLVIWIWSIGFIWGKTKHE